MTLAVNGQPHIATVTAMELHLTKERFGKMSIVFILLGMICLFNAIRHINKDKGVLWGLTAFIFYVSAAAL